ncbi:MAG TPA: CrcB family protein [Acidimicrobiales bacterium]|nr:CrcB family protein [Acidimicrobiales bacterium]
MRKRIRNNRAEFETDPDIDLLVDPDAEVILPLDDAHRLRDEIDIVLVILVGGFLGTLCRYELSLHWSQPDTAFPTTIFVINLSGSLLIGFVLTTIIEKMRPTRYLRPLTCVGFLGGWTTMSTFAVESDHLISSNHLGVAVTYILATMVVTPVVATFGISLAHLLPKSHKKIDRALEK